jgi:hypothetical protein
MSIDQNIGVQLPGSDQEQFNYGQDYRGLAVPDASIGAMPEQVLPDSFDIGALSADVGAMVDANVGLDSDASAMWNDTYDTVPNVGMDALEGVANDARIAELGDVSMYLPDSQGVPVEDFAFHKYPAGSNPLQPQLPSIEASED